MQIPGVRGTFHKIVDRLDALALGANRDGNENRRWLREDVAQGQPFNMLVLAYNCGQPIYSDDLEEDDNFMFANHKPTKTVGSSVRDFDRGSGYFRLNVKIPYFNNNLNIEDFIDWLADIDIFSDYLEVPEGKPVRLVACGLKGGASAWWERLQTQRIREGRQPIKTWYRMKQLLKRDFLPQIMNRSYSSNTIDVIRV